MLPKIYVLMLDIYDSYLWISCQSSFYDNTSVKFSLDLTYFQIHFFTRSDEAKEKNVMDQDTKGIEDRNEG